MSTLITKPMEVSGFRFQSELTSSTKITAPAKSTIIAIIATAKISIGLRFCNLPLTIF
ncbi:MAG TPA: hypothetical protein VIH03_04645 [Nitrososphaerales archaeon]